MALSFLLLVARSEPCKLTANAYTTAYSLPKNINLISSQWTSGGGTVITYNWGVLGVDDCTFQATEFTFNCRPRDGIDYDKVYYTVKIKDSYGSVIYQNKNQQANTTAKFTSNPYTIPYSDIAYRIEVTVFMVDGSWLYRDDIPYSSLTLQLNCLEQVEENTLPAEWLQSTAATTTSPFSTMTTIASDLIPDDQMIEQNLTTPPWIEGAVAQILALVSQIIQLRYIRFLLGFVIIVSLVAWFLH